VSYIVTIYEKFKPAINERKKEILKDGLETDFNKLHKYRVDNKITKSRYIFAIIIWMLRISEEITWLYVISLITIVVIYRFIPLKSIK